MNNSNNAIFYYIKLKKEKVLVMRKQRIFDFFFSDPGINLMGI